MTPEQAITQLHERGVILSGDGDRLHVQAPPGVVTPRLRDWLRVHKTDLLRVVSPPAAELADEDKDAILEAIEERAAIREFDGGETRVQAEQQARSAMRVYRYRLMDRPTTWLTLICPGCELADAHHVLASRFGEDRVVEVVEYLRGGSVLRDTYSRAAEEADRGR